MKLVEAASSSNFLSSPFNAVISVRILLISQILMLQYLLKVQCLTLLGQRPGGAGTHCHAAPRTVALLKLQVDATVRAEDSVYQYPGGG